MKIGCIIEARMTSSRLPGKVIMELMGQPSVIRQAERIKKSRYIDTVIVATTINAQDDIMVGMLEKAGIPVFRGSEDDVLGRVAAAAEAFKLDIVVEITGDCPLVDINESDRVIEHFIQGQYDLVSNNYLRTYPIGMDTIVISGRLLQEASQKGNDPAQREHVCLFMYENATEYLISNIEAPRFLREPNLRLTLDTKEDYQLISTIYEKLYPQKPDFNLYDIIKLLKQQPELREINRQVRQRKMR